MTDEELARGARAHRAARASDVDGVDRRPAPRRHAADAPRTFRDKAPISAAEAATIILDGVREERWRILVGEDAQVLDRMVREAPEEAYEAGVHGALRRAGLFGGIRSLSPTTSTAAATERSAASSTRRILDLPTPASNASTASCAARDPDTTRLGMPHTARARAVIAVMVLAREKSEHCSRRGRGESRWCDGSSGSRSSRPGRGRPGAVPGGLRGLDRSDPRPLRRRNEGRRLRAALVGPPRREPGPAVARAPREPGRAAPLPPAAAGRDAALSALLREVRGQRGLRPLRPLRRRLPPGELLGPRATLASRACARTATGSSTSASSPGAGARPSGSTST